MSFYLAFGIFDQDTVTAFHYVQTGTENTLMKALCCYIR